MKSNAISTPVELSYFRLSLLSCLRDAHPDKAADREFIASRGDAAAQTYSDIIRDGGTHAKAQAAADEILYAGLHFSPYRTLVTILWNEFADETDPAQAEELALELLPKLSKIFDRYGLSDDFAASREYDLLYTELTGAIQILLNHGDL